MSRSASTFLIKYPVIKVFIPFVIGILLSHFFTLDVPFSPFLWLSLFGFWLSLTVYLLKQKSSIGFLLVFLGIGVISFLRSEQLQSQKQHHVKQLQQIGLLSDSLALFAEIESVKETPRSFTYTISIDSLQFENQTIFAKSIQAQLIQYKSDSLSITPYRVQDHIQSIVAYRVFPEKRNPHQFDYAAFLINKGIVAQFEEQKNTQNFSQKGLYDVRLAFENTVELLFSPKEIGIAKALIIGDKSDINPEVRTEFSRSGLAHLMAVSGLHVGFLVAPFWVIIPWFWARKGGRTAAILFLGLVLLAYCWLTGFSASVVRASIMAFLFTYAKLFERVRYPMNIVGFAALLLLIYNPNYLFDVGFQLSFGAVSLILVIMPLFKSLNDNPTRLNSILLSMIVGIVVQIGLAPILASYFGEISLISPISNLFAMLPASLLVQFGLLGTVITLFIPELAPYMGFVLNYLAQILGYFAQFFSSVEFSYAEFAAPHPSFFLFWFSLMGLVAAFPVKHLRWKWLFFSFFCLVLWRGFLMFSAFQSQPLRLTVLDVAQGDANLIETPNGRVFLIDTGVWSPNYESGSRTIAPELRAKGIKQINGIILTHPHADHVGGTAYLLEHFKVDTLYTDTTLVHDRSFIFQTILDVARKKQIPIKELYAGDTLFADSELSFRVFWPLKGFKNHNSNEISTVLRLDYNKTSFLFTGDAEHEAEEWMSSTLDSALDTDFLKVGHHGSRSSSHTPFLADVTPKLASVSLGKVNKYKHPHAESMFRLQELSTNVNFTSLSGALIYESNGDSIWSVSWKN